MKTKNIKVPWTITNWNSPRGYITDFQPAKRGAKYPNVGTALYVADAAGLPKFQERRAMHVTLARELGLI